ncbi:MAG: nicotinate-nucleotide--dimethylbenzimidazole phosphoribosyltransferase [Dehalococcoidia bacterium]
MTPIHFDIPPLDTEASDLARQRQNTLTKPAGSLGLLEDIACRMAAIQGTPRPQIGQQWVVVAAADHGVAAEGVSAYPAEVTAQMVANFLSGGAAVSVLARCADARLAIVDAGIAGDVPGDTSALRRMSLGKGTHNMARGPAMSPEQAEQAIVQGAELARELAGNGAKIIAIGEMGIANTTAASAITSVITVRPPGDVTGRGTGIDNSGLARKIGVIMRALTVNRPDRMDAMNVLASVGGFEIGLLAGVMLGAAEQRVAVVLDGFISTAAGLIAHGIDPRVLDYTFASHLSVEPGHALALSHMGLRTILDLEMRLGEGTGAVMGMQIIHNAVSLHNEMATFEEALVSQRDEGGA